ncbi:hypothetical protein DSO57_1026435 [Entomophthora muscae]|uniref:Uncharacterized protein n=1 Tax=Entomophthora muscae TaxID=34485 RepID=A0ACC2S414_9FUNG|nr:hypothetical protein DSO57_1026435 [Entomophthora muscae]
MEGTQQQSNNAPVVRCSCSCPRGSKNQVSSINPWVPKLTWKPTKFTTTKKVNNKEVELTLYVFDVVYQQELVPSAMLEKDYGGQLVLKKVVAFYNKVHMPCVPVPEKDPSSIKPIKAAQKLILNIKCIILIRLMQESCNYKTVASLVGVDPKYASKVFNKYIDTSQVLAVEKSLHVSIISFENQIFIYKLVGGNGGHHRGLPNLHVSTMLTKEHK